MEDICVRVTQENCTQEARKKEATSIVRNVAILSVAITLLFSSYLAMENLLQSSINKNGVSPPITAIYTSLIISSCLLPTLLLRTLRAKYTLLVCFLCYVAHMASQVSPNVYLLVPTAVLMGLATGPLWVAQGTYITKVGARYAELTGENAGVVITRFFGIFFAFFGSTQIWANLISSTVLSSAESAASGEMDSEMSLLSCGYRYCISGNTEDHRNSMTANNNSDSLPQGVQPATWQIRALTASYISGAFLSALIIFFGTDLLLNSKQRESHHSPKDEKKLLGLLSATFNHMRHPYQVLLVPLTIWSGFEKAFIAADFTDAYVLCGPGEHILGYSMICYGVCNVIGSMSSSHMVRSFGRVPLMALGFLINVSSIISLILWIPRPRHLVSFFVLLGSWGFADSVWTTQLNSLYGSLFPGETEPAFSHLQLWQATGYALSFGLSSAMCISAKVNVILAFLVLGIIGYFFVAFLETIGGIPKDDNGRSIPIDVLLRGNR